jgi:hypothetical protein
MKHMCLAGPFAALLAFGLVGCGGSQTARGTAQSAAPPDGLDMRASLETTAATASRPTIRRSDVRAVVSAGLGAFLQRISFEDMPAMVNGKFYGFKVQELKGDLWQGVDLKPGDVIRKVNGQSIEHPGDALEVFRSLELAGELAVDYERDGKAKLLRYGIVDDGGAGRPATR